MIPKTCKKEINIFAVFYVSLFYWLLKRQEQAVILQIFRLLAPLNPFKNTDKQPVESKPSDMANEGGLNCGEPDNSESETANFRNGMYYSNARCYNAALHISAVPTITPLVAKLEELDDASLGRFTTEDPIRDGANWYVYCSNNPLRFVDPTGLSGESEEQESNWEERFYEYSSSVLEIVQPLTPEEENELYESIEPASNQYSDEQLNQVRIQMIDLENEVSEQRMEVYDLINDLYHSCSEAEGLIQEGTLSLLIPSPPGKTGYELTEFIIPEFKDEVSNIFSIPGQIDIAINEYEMTSIQLDIIKKEFISQVKLR